VVVQAHDAATEIDLGLSFVDDVRRDEAHVLQRRGHAQAFAEQPLVGGPLLHQLVALRAVVDDGGLALEHLRAEPVFGVEVRGRQVQPPGTGQAPGGLQHAARTVGPEAGVDDQHGIAAGDQGDVRHQDDLVPVFDHVHARAHLDEVGRVDQLFRRDIPLGGAGRRARQR